MADWFQDWFASDFYLSVYSHRNEADAEKFLNNILEYIPLPENAKVLDAACGSGRHSIIMAKKKYAVTAFDLSRPLLKIAVENAKALNLDINFFNGDLRYIDLKEKFNLILNLFTSFGYFDNDSENFAFIESSYNMLVDKGCFVFDYLNEAFVRKNLVSESEKNIYGLTILEKREIKNNRVVKSITIEREGSTNNYEESVQLYSFDEIKEHFSRIGFKPVQVFGKYDCSEFLPYDSERLIIIFQK
jgi:SAM-dependent methyltransferase